MPAGRPTLYTAELGEEVCKALRAGSYLETAASYNGLSVSTLRDWIRTGRRDRRAGEETILAQFSAAVDRAQAEAELRAVQALNRAADPHDEVVTTTEEEVVGGIVVRRTTSKQVKPVLGDWRAALARLERVLPERWAPALRLHRLADRRVKDLLDRLQEELPPDVYRQVLAALEGIAAASGEAAEDGAGGDATADPDGD